MTHFAAVHRDLLDLVEAFADLSLVRTPDDLNEENVRIMRRLAEKAREAVAAHRDVSDLGFDREATNHPPGSMLTGTGTPHYWFDFKLAFHDEGTDLDTVRAVLGLRPGWVLHVEPAQGEALDLVFSDVEQDDDPVRDWEVFLVGNRYDDTHIADNEYRGEPVRIPLAGARLTIY